MFPSEYFIEPRRLIFNSFILSRLLSRDASLARARTTMKFPTPFVYLPFLLASDGIDVGITRTMRNANLHVLMLESITCVSQNVYSELKHICISSSY